jgi:CheY-like chemotaxis protein
LYNVYYNNYDAIRQRLFFLFCEKTILIAAVHEDTGQILHKLNENLGCIVLEAANWLDAVESVQKIRPDLILMDKGVP